MRAISILLAFMCAALFTACNSCTQTPTPNPSECRNTLDLLPHASDSFQYLNLGSIAPPLNDLDWKYISSDNTLHTIKTEDVTGFAFSMGRFVPSGGLGIPPLGFGTMFLLQYDFPSKTCLTKLNWEIHPQVIFPNGYLFSSMGRQELSVELFAFEDPIGAYDLTDSNPTGMASVVNEMHRLASESGDPDKFKYWTDNQNTGSPVYVSRTFRGEFNAPAGIKSRLFVGASVVMWGGNPGESAELAASVQINSLLDAGIFRATAPGAGAADNGHFGPEYSMTPIQ